MSEASGELRVVFERKVTSYSLCDAIDNIRATRVRAIDYISLLLDRREQYGKGLAAIITMTDAESARVNAKNVDDAVASRKLDSIPTLTAIPFIVSDNIETADMVTCGGLEFLDQWQPTQDALPIIALTNAGGINFGKANVQELGHGVLGTNSHYIAAKNPYAPSHITGGPNGGIAAAVSARIVPIGIGLDTCGGIRIPAALTGLVGFRPTFGRYGTSGWMPVSHTLDTCGLIARTVKDVELVDAVIADAAKGEPHAHYDTKLTGVRLGYPSASMWAGVDPQVSAVMTAAIEKLTSAGAELVECEIPEVDVEYLKTVYYHITDKLVGFECLREFCRYLYEAGVKTSIVDIVEAYPGTQKSRLEGYLSGSPDAGAVTSAEYRETLVTARPALQAALAAFFQDNNVEAVIYPTTLVAARPVEEAVVGSIEVNGVAVTVDEAYARNTAVASTAGLPAITVPAGLTNGEEPHLPVGIEFMGKENDDARLLQIARAFQETYPQALAPPKLRSDMFV